jgi:hypothetical protein
MTNTPDNNADYFRTSSKKGRGRAKASETLIDAMYKIAEATQPITGRGVGYKLFTMGLIKSMARSEMAKVYRLLVIAREEEIIPWDWIVDETRQLERVATWDNPDDYIATMMRSYRRDFWNHQPHRVEVWSEKGTVRGVLRPVLNHCGVGFRVLHGFNSATCVWDIAQDYDGRPLLGIYIGDRDPSGLYMSDVDLPKRIEQYGGDHIVCQRVALLPDQVERLPSFPASDKAKDPRFKWWSSQGFGDRCWEVDAMDPRDLRTIVRNAIEGHIDWAAWNQCERVYQAEKESMEAFFKTYKAKPTVPLLTSMTGEGTVICLPDLSNQTEAP